MNKLCVSCGKEFNKKSNESLTYWSSKKYCSKKCAWESQKGKLHSEDHKLKIRESCKGLRNSGSFKRQMPIGQKCSFCERLADYMNPKPSCSMHYKRHWYRYKRQWVGGKCELIHRLIMEKHLGRKLLSTEVVHHIDGDRDNNVIDNLMLFPSNKSHLNFHHFQK